MFKKFTCHLYLILILSFALFPLSAQEGPQKNTDLHREKLLHLFSGEWISRAIYVATKLEIPELLESGPKSIDELARIVSADPESLYRLLHMLAGHSIFKEDDSKIFSNTYESSLLTQNHPHSLHSLCLFYGEDIHKAWDSLLTSIEQGTPAFQLTFDQPVFSYFKNNKSRAQLFQAAMKEKSKAVIESALTAYDFSRFNKVYDIGGGHGQFLQALSHQYPHISADLFELPEVIASLSHKELNMHLQVGNFFASIPSNGDLYILKSVLHDWDDKDAAQILQNCYQAMNEDSRLIIIEVVLLPEDRSLYANSMDLLMLAITGGKERTLASFEDLLEKANLSLEKIYPTTTEFSILEVKKAK